MGFTHKDWVSETNPLGPPANPLTATEVNGPALIDLEQRLSGYSEEYAQEYIGPVAPTGVGDAIVVTDAAITTGTALLSSTDAAFTSADATKLISVDGAGTAGGPLISSITSVSGGVATLAANAATTVTNAECHFGTDNYAALTALIAARTTPSRGGLQAGNMVQLGPGRMMFSQTPMVPSGTMIAGAGPSTVLDASAVSALAGTNIYAGLAAVGTLGSFTAPTVDVHSGDQEIQVTSSSGVDVGDWIMLATQGPRGTVHTSITSSGLSVIVDQVAGTAAFSPCGVLAIDSELVSYSSVSVSGSQSTFTIRSTSLVGRGYRGTSAAAHSAGATVTEFHGGKFRLFETNTVFDRGEPLQVTGTTATSIMFENPIEDDYPIAYAAGWAPINTVRDVTVRHATIEHSGSLRSASRIEVGFWGQYVDNLKLTGNQSNYAGYYCIGLDSCTNAVITHNQMRGKAVSDPGDAHPFYAVALYNSCSNIQVVGNGARRAFKLVTTSCNSAGQRLFGCPRYVTVTGNDINNSGSAYFARHAGYEFHGGGDHIEFAGNSARGCDSLISVQCADHVNISGGNGGGWYRSGIVISQSHKIRDIRVSGLSVGKRTIGTGRTTLTAAITDTSAGDTISVASTVGLQDDQTVSTVINQILIDSEVIEYGVIDSTHLNASQRGRWGTTAATHSNGAAVLPYGSGVSQPISVDLRLCVWAQRAYNQPTTTLGASATSSDTTITLTDATGWPTSGTGMIEGADSARTYEPEVFAWTGLSGAVLSGVTRGLLGTTAVSHLSLALVQPYEPGVIGLVVEDCTVEMGQGANAINQLGYLPVHNSGFYRNRLTWTNQQTAANNYAINTQADLLNLADNDIDGFASGVLAQGNQTEIKGGKISARAGQTAGQAIEVTGDRNTIEGVHWINTFYGVIDDGTNTRVLRCTSDGVATLTHQISNSSDTSLVARDNLVIGETLSVTAASTLTLPMPGNLFWHVSGATAVTTIPAQADGTEITLLFAAAGQVTAGSNLKISGNFTPGSSGGTITLVCDGTNWWEKARVYVA